MPPPVGAEIPDALKAAGSAITFLVMFAPGFVAMKAYDWFSAAEPRQAKDMLYEIIGYSVICYAIAGPFFVWFWNQRAFANTMLDAIALWLILLALPFALGALVAFLQKRAISSGRRFVSQVKTAWDWAFLTRSKCLIEVGLPNGTSVIGEPGSVSNYPFEHEIFLRRVWELDSQNKLQRKQDTMGMLLLKDSITSVEFFKHPKPGTVTPEPGTINTEPINVTPESKAIPPGLFEKATAGVLSVVRFVWNS